MSQRFPRPFAIAPSSMLGKVTSVVRSSFFKALDICPELLREAIGTMKGV